MEICQGTRRLGVAGVYVGAWWAVWGSPVDLGLVESVEVLVAGTVLTSVGVGRFIGQWWALPLPMLVSPAFAVPWGYTPGASPDYGVGLFVAAGFLTLALPSMLAGERRLGRRAPWSHA